MTTDTPESVLRDLSGIPTAASEAGTAHPGLSLEAGTGAVGILEYALYGMTVGNQSMVEEAVCRLREAIELEKKKEEKKERKAKRKEKKEKRKEEKLKVKKEKENITTPTTSGRVMTGSLIPHRPVARRTSWKHQKIAKNFPTSPILQRRATAAHRAPREVPQEPQRRSTRIMELAEKNAQDKLSIASTARGRPAVATRVKKKPVGEMRDQIVLKAEGEVVVNEEREGPAEATVKVESPILKSWPGAGVTNKTLGGSSKSRSAAKAGAEEKMEKEVGNQSIAATADTDKVTEAHRARASREASQGPEHLSTCITDLKQKSGQEEGESAAEKVVTKVGSPGLEPTEGEGVPKRRGRGSFRGSLSGRARGGKRASAQSRKQG